MPSTPHSSRITRENRLRRGLRPRREAAILSNREKLFASLNHDVRTPMNGVIGMLNLLIDSGLSSQQFALAQAASDSAAELFFLLRDVLDFSLIEAEADLRKNTTFDLFRQLDEVVRSQSLMARSQAIHLSTRYSGSEFAMVSGDARGLAQVLNNIIDLAMSAQPHKALMLDIDIEQRINLRCRLNVRVRRGDHPPAAGASPARPVRTPFAHEGGLRMALTMRLLAAMNGRAGIERQSRQSDQYWIEVEFPVAVNPLMDLRLLFVEADPDLRSDRMVQLQAYGIDAHGFDSMSAALTALTAAAQGERPFQVAIIDQNMQGIDGEMTGKIIAGDPTYAATRLLMLSPAGDEMEQYSSARLANAGFHAWLKQPFTPHVLLSTLAQMIGPRETDLTRPFLTNQTPRTNGDRLLPFAGYRILAVDDNPVNLQVLVLMLRNLGCTVETATDGRAAVASHRAGNFDLIFMDCLMTEVDGYQATMQIREHEGPGKHTPIIAVTAATLPVQADRGMAAGMDDLIAKPIGVDVLRHALVRWLRPATNDALESVRDLFGTDYIELATLFLADSPKRLLALQRAVDARDTPAVAKVAHTLAGSTASIGATSLSTLCLELEVHCKSEHPGGVAARLQALELEYDRVSERLRIILQEMTRTP
jgi:CheY-like chemotaxis protein